MSSGPLKCWCDVKPNQKTKQKFCTQTLKINVFCKQVNVNKCFYVKFNHNISDTYIASNPALYLN